MDIFAFEAWSSHVSYIPQFDLFGTGGVQYAGDFTEYNPPKRLSQTIDGQMMFVCVSAVFERERERRCLMRENPNKRCVLAQ